MKRRLFFILIFALLGAPAFVQADLLLGVAPGPNSAIKSREDAAAFALYLKTALGEKVTTRIFPDDQTLYSWMIRFREVDLALLSHAFYKQLPSGDTFLLANLAPETATPAHLVSSLSSNPSKQDKRIQALRQFSAEPTGMNLIKNIGISRIELSTPTQQVADPASFAQYDEWLSQLQWTKEQKPVSAKPSKPKAAAPRAAKETKTSTKPVIPEAPLKAVVTAKLQPQPTPSKPEQATRIAKGAPPAPPQVDSAPQEPEPAVIAPVTPKATKRRPTISIPLPENLPKVERINPLLNIIPVLALVLGLGFIVSRRRKGKTGNQITKKSFPLAPGPQKPITSAGKTDTWSPLAESKKSSAPPRNTAQFPPNALEPAKIPEWSEAFGASRNIPSQPDGISMPLSNGDDKGHGLSEPGFTAPALTNEEIQSRASDEWLSEDLRADIVPPEKAEAEPALEEADWTGFDGDQQSDDGFTLEPSVPEKEAEELDSGLRRTDASDEFEFPVETQSESYEQAIPLAEELEEMEENSQPEKSPAPVDSPLKMEGVLDTVEVPVLLQMIATHTKPVTLIISSRQDEKHLHFRNGKIASAYSINHSTNAQSEFLMNKLGYLLVRQGKVSEAERDRALELCESPKKLRIGEALIEIGAISHTELIQALRTQAEGVIFSLFIFAEGNFRLVYESPSIPQESDLAIDIRGLLDRAIRNENEWSKIRSRIPSLDSILQVTANGIDKLNSSRLTVHQRLILSLVNGRRSIHEICMESTMLDFEVYNFLYLLVNAKILSLANDFTSSDFRAVGD